MTLRRRPPASHLEQPRKVTLTLDDKTYSILYGVFDAWGWGMSLRRKECRERIVLFIRYAAERELGRLMRKARREDKKRRQEAAP